VNAVSAPDLLKMFLSLLALVNPLGAIPFFISFTTNQTDAERHSIARVASLSVITVIAFTALVGERFIGFFGISVEAFQVGGGIIMLLMSLSMINGQVGGSKHTAEESVEAEIKQSIAVVPLAIPLLTGPGTISTVIVYADRVHSLLQICSLIACGIAIGFLTYLALLLADPISRVLGRTGINIATRLMGLLLAALATEFIVGGLMEMIPAFRHSA
jgi:multiple antibiotic resistance protein